ncbi:hypothetical protein FACS189451_11440 [Bacteroidia bacterium]|nr:hypothetical protein FACS189451_11440 [Bacteroidia bacterium]
MVLVPVEDAGQWGFHEFGEGDFHADGAEADAFGGVADAEHGDAFAGDVAFFAQCLAAVGAAVVFGEHAQAGGAAVHGVELGVVGERFMLFSHDFIQNFPEHLLSKQTK